MASGNDELITREVSFEVGGDGRTIEALIVPYNTVARVSDPPSFEMYDERWLPGAFEKQTKAADRIKVWLNFEHEEGLRGIVGHGVELREESDGLYGTFRVHNNADGDKALELIGENIVTGMSLEAVPLRTRVNNGVVERVKATLRKASLTWRPAYQTAQVVAVREESEPEPEPEDPAPEPAPEPEVSRSDVSDALQRMGYERVSIRSTTSKPWDSDTERFTDEEYERSALVTREGDAPIKERCILPVLEPTGELNINALENTAKRLSSADLTPEERSAVARKLVRMYRQADMTPSPKLVTQATR
jgi:HK97 family phage prohead protease